MVRFKIKRVTFGIKKVIVRTLNPISINNFLHPLNNKQEKTYKTYVKQQTGRKNGYSCVVYL